ncbi:uncharacterized protein LOC133522360 [Cydia pomonella]|uniref:uncharacterized protein LOC133522360 n=1 Tax=Cydia pomonella TaxID=82600 RepID=UPI002ADDE7BC|nr:uncharacterized protein LOC133522360 [Cydia pomonella]
MRTGLPDTVGGSSNSNACDLRKAAVISMELHRLNISIAALQETRLPDEGSLREAQYTFFWRGKGTDAVREHGVGFAVRSDLLKAIEKPLGVSERIMMLRVNTNSGYITLISAYAPTLTSADEAKDRFYEQLHETVRRVKSSDRLYVLGDFNARVGQDRVPWLDCIGEHGIGKQNENGQRLLEFCSRNLLCVTNTYFKGKLSRQVSWKHPRSGHWHQLDMILSRRRHLRETLHTRTFHSAECDTDHSLVVARVAFTHKKIHSSRPSGKKKLNVFNTRNHELVSKFEELVRSAQSTWSENAQADDTWRSVRSLLTDTAGSVFGYREIKTQDWFAENAEHLKPLVDYKREAALKHRMRPTPETRENLKNATSTLQRNARHFANVYWTNVCTNIQKCVDAGNFSGVYSGIKQVLGPVPKKTAPLKEVDGTIITDSCRQLKRWVEHYTELYSNPIAIDSMALVHTPKLATWFELDVPPSVEEFHKAIKQLKRGKSPGNDAFHNGYDLYTSANPRKM